MSGSVDYRFHEGTNRHPEEKNSASSSLLNGVLPLSSTLTWFFRLADSTDYLEYPERYVEGSPAIAVPGNKRMCRSP